MAGLCVVLETQDKNQPGKPAKIISKATLLHGPKLQVSPTSPPTTTRAASSFLQRCSLCHKVLAEGTDIYMYRGDRAFCSAECRSRQIFMDEDEDAAAGDGSSYTKRASAARGSRRAGGGGFAF